MSASVTHDGTTIISNYESESEIRQGLGIAAEGKAESTPAVVKSAAEESTAEESESTAPPSRLDRRTREGRRQSFQSELDALTERTHTARKEAEAEEARRETIRREIAELETRRTAQPIPAAAIVDPPKPPSQSQPAAQATDDPKPTQDQFAQDPSGDPLTAWYDALSAWNARKIYRESETQRIAREQASAQQQELQARRQAVRDRVLKSLGVDGSDQRAFEAAWTAKGISPVFSTAEFRPLSTLEPDAHGKINGDYRNAIGEVVLTSDRPVELMLELGKADVLQRLSTLKPDEFYQAIGEIKHGLVAATNGPVAKPQKFSAASPPTKPLGSSPLAAVDAPPGDDASDEEHERYYGKMRKQAHGMR